MAFGINRKELIAWKHKVSNGEIAFLTHYWIDDRFPGCHTVTKVGCSNLETLISWGNKYSLKKEWIDLHKKFPHFDLFGELQKDILIKEGKTDQIEKFNL